VIKLTTIPVTTTQSKYQATLTVPNVLPRRYPVVVLQEAKDGSIAQVGSASFKVTATQ